MIRLLTITLLLCSLYSGLSQQVYFTDGTDNFSEPHSYGYETILPGGVVGGGVSTVDFNKDGFDDLTLGSELGIGIGFYLGSENGSFQKTNLCGIEHEGRSKQILWADIDNDDDYDLFVTANKTGNHLYLNNGDFCFTDITNTCGIDSSTVANLTFTTLLADFNDDGNLDLYVTNRTVGGNFEPTYNIMYYGNGDGTFTDVTEETNTANGFLAPLAAIAYDFDLDGDEDIYIGQDKNYGNSLLRNNDGVIFDDYSAESGTDYIMNAMNADAADIDNNGYLDLYITNSFHGNKLILNDEGLLEDYADDRDVAMHDDFTWGGSWVDIDNDLDLDLYVCAAGLYGARKNSLFINTGYAHFELADESYGFENDSLRSYGNMFGDFNNDGYPDFAVNNYEATSSLWYNSGSTNNWIKYILKGSVSNRDGIGALVYLYVDGVSYLRSTHCGQGFLSQQSYTKLFGMGEASQVDSAKVVWPSGMETWHYNLQNGQTYTLEETASLSAEVIADNGLVLCPGESTELSVNGTFDTILWNGLEQETYTTNESGSVLLEVSNEFGLTYEEEIFISVMNENFSINSLLGTTVCPGVTEAPVTLDVSSDLPYQVYWDGVESENFTVLSVGEHQLMVQDEAGCTLTHQAVIMHSEELIVEEIISHVECHDESSGELILDISGANPFDITINNEVGNLFNNGLTAGEYTIGITDANGCQVQEEYIILEPEELIVTSSSTPDFGTNDGTIILEISGGTEPYTISQNLEHLAHGSYTITVCDANGCCTETTAVIDFEVSLLELEKNFQLYPNPATNYVLIESDKWIDRNWKLIDMTGREHSIKMQLISDSIYKIDVTHLSNGMYTIFNGELNITFEVRR